MLLGLEHLEYPVSKDYQADMEEAVMAKAVLMDKVVDRDLTVKEAVLMAKAVQGQDQDQEHIELPNLDNTLNLPNMVNNQANNMANQGNQAN